MKMKMKMKTTLTVLLILELCGLSSGIIKRHFFVNDQKKWDEARKLCKERYHDLSTFTDEKEKMLFLADLADLTVWRKPWIGLKKKSEVWKWIGGELATNISWDRSNVHADHEDCVFIDSATKGLHDERCDDSHTFFCMRIEFAPVLQTESWEGALKYCRTQHNDLASLSSVNMMDTALAQITQTQTQYVWTGLRFLAGEWFWISGDDLDFTAMSLPQCPAGNLRCGALQVKTKVWTNRDCEEKLSFFCQ